MSPKILRMRFFLLPTVAPTDLPATSVALVAMEGGASLLLQPAGQPAEFVSHGCDRRREKAAAMGKRSRPAAALHFVSRSAAASFRGRPPRQARLARSVWRGGHIGSASPRVKP